nr:RAMP superfamily CRISPR-associated protein [uncultured Cohaesibacter sp.]
MNERRKYTLKLQLESPFMFESEVNNRVGVDCAFLRDENDAPIIPAAQIKGVLRDALEHLASATDLVSLDETNALFGVASQEGDDLLEQARPERALGYWGDLTAAIDPNQTCSTTRIEIDDEKGNVKRGSLQVIELAAPFGQQVAFEGPLVVHYAKGMGAERIEKAINCALHLIPAIGAYKSAGFGAVVSEKCGINFQTISSSELPSAESKLPLRTAFNVTFDRPLLVDTSRAADNVFESAVVIPGSVFKGALAERLSRAGLEPENEATPLGQALAALSISHAFPLISGKGQETCLAELPIPASVLYVKSDNGERYFDAINAPRPGVGILLKNETTQTTFVFTGKSKDKEAFRKNFGMPEFPPNRVVRTHVSINENVDGQRNDIASRSFTAEDKKLYSSSMLPVRGQKWRLTIDATRISDPKIAEQLLAAFTQEMDGIGKTAAIASFEADQLSEPTAIEGEIFDIMLVTPAVLFDPVEGDEATKRSSSELYEAYFKEHLEADLVNFFARQTFAGQYPAVRRRPYGKSTYYPFVLTQKGAVFRIKLTSEQSREKLRDALAFGLPCPEIGGEPANWKRCPFVPENGYGAIQLHDPKKRLSSNSQDAAKWVEPDGLEFVEGL